MSVQIDDWKFGTSNKCDRCGRISMSYSWDMAKVDGKWMCMDCLGSIVQRENIGSSTTANNG